MANLLPCGVYTTNNVEACAYVATDSQAEIVVLDNEKMLEKYLEVRDTVDRLKWIVVYETEKEEF